MEAGPGWAALQQAGAQRIEVAANGLMFEVAEAGSGDHLALCLHGFPELNFSWRFQIPLLVELGYRVWAPNLRGYGGSSRPEGVAAYQPELLLADIAALVDASGCKRLTILAHDWGGALAWLFAIRRIRPLTQLVVMNFPHPRGFANAARHWRQRLRSWYMLFFQLPRLPEFWLGRNGAAGIRRSFHNMAIDKSRFPPEVLDVYAHAASQPGALTAMVNWYRAAARYRPQLAIGRGLVDVPTLLIWGEADSALGLETLEGTDKYVSQLRIHRLPGVSHWVQQEAPEAVNAVLKDWLQPPGSADQIEAEA